MLYSNTIGASLYGFYMYFSCLHLGKKIWSCLRRNWNWTYIGIFYYYIIHIRWCPFHVIINRALSKTKTSDYLQVHQVTSYEVLEVKCSLNDFSEIVVKFAI